MGSEGEKVERGGGARESGRASMAKENGDEGDVRGERPAPVGDCGPRGYVRGTRVERDAGGRDVPGRTEVI